LFFLEHVLYSHTQSCQSGQRYSCQIQIGLVTLELQKNIS